MSVPSIGRLSSVNATFQKIRQSPTTNKIIDFLQENAITIIAGAFIGGAVAIAFGTFPAVVAGALVGAVVFTLFKYVFDAAYNRITDSNQLYKVGRVWELEELLDSATVDRVLKRIEADLKALPVDVKGSEGKTVWDVFDEMSKDRIHDSPEEGKNDFRFDNPEGMKKTLNMGVCLGQARAQLEYMSTNFNVDSKAIQRVPLEHREEVIYYQMLSNIQAYLVPVGVKVSFALQLANTEDFEHYPRLIGEGKAAARKITEMGYIVKNTCDFNTSTQVFKGLSTPEEYQKNFEETVKEFKPDTVVSGWLEIYSPDTQLPGHVIWFQCSDGKFRIQDTIDERQGLYEFPTKEAFFKGLKKQAGVHWNYNLGMVRFVAYSIKKASGETP